MEPSTGLTGNNGSKKAAASTAKATKTTDEYRANGKKQQGEDQTATYPKAKTATQEARYTSAPPSRIRSAVFTAV